jgi:serine/threonine-protein kinase
LTAELVVHKGESSSSTYRFAIRTKQSALTTGLAVGIVVLALFAVAYIESYIRTLRRGRSRVSGSFGLTLSAAAAGVAATVGWLRVGTKYRYRRARRRSSH